MPLSLINEAKNSGNRTWNDYTTSWDASPPDTWDTQYGIPLTNESKNNLGIANESKPSSQTIDDMPVSIDSVSTIIDQAGTPLILEQKT